WLVPPSVRPGVWTVAQKSHPVLYRYIGGVIVVVAVASVLCYIGAGLLLGLPDAVVVSLAVGVLEAVPVIGPITSAALLAIIAIGQGTMSILVGVALFAFSLRLFIDQLMAPIILGKAVRLHPAIIIFAFLAGGTLFGILGVLLAVPAAAVTKVALQVHYGDSADSTMRRGGNNSGKILP
ncbi:MAG TPA: AI-2E family transporter, partial [Tepidisphaeraceae bacterium]|nr:AI-2E family transporter [Tepidisphaeraceae bacterium]